MNEGSNNFSVDIIFIFYLFICLITHGKQSRPHWFWLPRGEANNMSNTSTMSQQYTIQSVRIC